MHRDSRRIQKKQERKGEEKRETKNKNLTWNPQSKPTMIIQYNFFIIKKTLFVSKDLLKLFQKIIRDVIPFKIHIQSVTLLSCVSLLAKIESFRVFQFQLRMHTKKTFQLHSHQESLQDSIEVKCHKACAHLIGRDSFHLHQYITIIRMNIILYK